MGQFPGTRRPERVPEAPTGTPEHHSGLRPVVQSVQYLLSSRTCAPGYDYATLATVTKVELDAWVEEEVVELPGYRTDIAVQYGAANIVCLPSYYGEGLPKSLVEAAACGRAVITTNHPGCRDAIVPGKTGILVPVKDATAIANAIEALVNEPERRAQMGAAARKLAEEAFPIEKIVDQHLAIYEELLTDG